MLEIVTSIFGSKESFSKYTNEGYQRNFNRAIFDIMCYYFSDNNIRTQALIKKTEIKSKFEELCLNNPDFLSSFEHTTKSIFNVSTRLSIWGNSIKEIIEIDFKIPTLTGNRIKLK